MTDTSQVHLVHYIPIATTIVAAVFATSLYRRYLQRRTPHLWWWAVGVAFYGLGTLIEATITLNGNTVFLTKAWYIAGAVLGGYPRGKRDESWQTQPRGIPNPDSENAGPMTACPR